MNKKATSNCFVAFVLRSEKKTAKFCQFFLHFLLGLCIIRILFQITEKLLFNYLFSFKSPFFPCYFADTVKYLYRFFFAFYIVLYKFCDKHLYNCLTKD